MNGPQQNPWNIQNQGSQNSPYYNPNNPYDPNNPNNPNNPYNSGGNSNTANGIPGSGAPPANPFPEGPGTSRVNELPYELIPDTLTTLTCENFISFTPSNFPYALSMGSYRTSYGGLKLSKDFITNHGISSKMPHQKVRQLLEASSLKRSMAQIAIRNENDINRIFTNQQTGKPILNYFPRFDNADNLDRLSRQGVSFTTRSYSSSQVNNSGRFQTLLPTPGGSFIQLARGLEENTLGEALLTLTYSIRNPNPIYAPDRRPYGRSYKVRWDDPDTADYLTGVYEENLRSSKREGKWDCPLKFVVHRNTKEEGFFNKSKDRYKGSIPDDLLKEGFCYTGKSAMTQLIRQFFEEEFGTSNTGRLPFHFGTTVIFNKDGNGVEKTYMTQQACIVPKKGSCYYQGFYRVEFDPNKECSDRYSTLYNRYGKDSMEEDYYKVCPGYLSVCFRVGD